ncbi:MAG: hypothetical protein JNK88_11685 [Mangrovicoccus sp.]|nr:hypothetical protein [Mangrovicoccus sp.]
MKHLVLTTAVALGLAAPAFAADQIAGHLNVAPGQYSQTELARLKAAQNAGDAEQVAALKVLFDGTGVSTQSVGVEPGHAQLAANLGLDPNAYTTAELARIKAARNDGDGAQVAALESLYAGETVSTQSAGVNGGQRQLAARAGVDPETTSLQETVDAWFGRLSY